VKQCLNCGKKLRKDNKYGYCQAPECHKALYAANKTYRTKRKKSNRLWGKLQYWSDKEWAERKRMRNRENNRRRRAKSNTPSS
jgi:hypothetical protein